MIIDVTGTILIPGFFGRDCPGNGKHTDENGEIIECCCDECDYMWCCWEGFTPEACTTCDDLFCPFAKGRKKG